MSVIVVRCVRCERWGTIADYRREREREEREGGGEGWEMSEK